MFIFYIFLSFCPPLPFFFSVVRIQHLDVMSASCCLKSVSEIHFRHKTEGMFCLYAPPSVMRFSLMHSRTVSGQAWSSPLLPQTRRHVNCDPVQSAVRCSLAVFFFFLL
jgi:hypothetical protein